MFGFKSYVTEVDFPQIRLKCHRQERSDAAISNKDSYFVPAFAISRKAEFRYNSRREEGMSKHEWIGKFSGAVTVCDRDGVILEMNEESARTFASDGGASLVGKSVFNCHPEAARVRLRSLLAGGKPNVYTIQKSGLKKLVYQAPWFDSDGALAGLVEWIVEIPAAMPHFDRDKPKT